MIQQRLYRKRTLKTVGLLLLLTVSNHYINGFTSSSSNVVTTSRKRTTTQSSTTTTLLKATNNNNKSGFGTYTNGEFSTPQLSRDKRSRVTALAIDYNDVLQQKENTIFKDNILPILSSAMLITGNTVGAGCLVMPELAVSPGLGITSGIYVGAWIINLISGLILAEVAIRQKEMYGNDAPSSFKEFAQVNLNSNIAGTIVSTISLFVNTLVLAFDIGKAGSVGATLTGLSEPTIAILWSTTLLTMLTSLSNKNLSTIANICVTGLFISFGGILVPGLSAVPNVIETFTTPGTSPECFSCITHITPIILMSMIYQNIVPTITKQLDYNRNNVITAITIGSIIPLGMYIAWCYACLGGGINMSNLTTGISGILMTLFSISTLGGSSLGSSLSLSEELDNYFGNKSNNNKKNQGDDNQVDVTTSISGIEDITNTNNNNNKAFQTPAAAVAVSVPLLAALIFGNQDGGLTNALSLAGSFGSPLLYGVLPALMAWNQRQEQEQQKSNKKKNDMSTPLVPAFSLPMLGILSTGFIGQEVMSQFNQVFASI